MRRGEDVRCDVARVFNLDSKSCCPAKVNILSLVLNTIRANVGLRLKKTGSLESEICVVCVLICVCVF